MVVAHMASLEDIFIAEIGQVTQFYAVWSPLTTALPTFDCFRAYESRVKRKIPGFSLTECDRLLFGSKSVVEPPHDKTNKMTVCPAKTQISLGICPVWSESSLCAQWVAKDPSFLHADSEDWSDWADAQADLSLCWAHMTFCWFCHEVAHFYVHDVRNPK